MFFFVMLLRGGINLFVNMIIECLVLISSVLLFFKVCVRNFNDKIVNIKFSLI